MDVHFSFFRKQIRLLSQLEGNLKRFHNNVISLLELTYTGQQVVCWPEPGFSVVWIPFQNVWFEDIFRSSVFGNRPKSVQNQSKQHLHLVNLISKMSHSLGETGASNTNVVCLAAF